MNNDIPNISVVRAPNVGDFVLVRAGQPLERMPNDQKGERIVLRSSQFVRRHSRIFASGQTQVIAGRIEQRRIIAGQQIEVVQPGCGGGLEDIAPDQMMLPANQKLADIRPVQRIVAWPAVQIVLVALGGQPLTALADATADAFRLADRRWPELLIVCHPV